VNLISYSLFRLEFTPFSGGTGGLGKFINRHKQEMGRFKLKGNPFNLQCHKFDIEMRAKV